MPEWRYSLIDPGVTGFWTGKLKITIKKAAQLTTMALISQPNLPRLKRLFRGRYLGSRDRYINKEAGKAKDISSVTMAVPMKTLKARKHQREAYFPFWLCWWRRNFSARVLRRRREKPAR